jgi:hypothetical protein
MAKRLRKDRKEPRQPASAAPHRRDQRIARWPRAFPLWRSQPWNVLIGAFYVAVHVCILVHDLNTPEVSPRCARGSGSGSRLLIPASFGLDSSSCFIDLSQHTRSSSHCVTHSPTLHSSSTFEPSRNVKPSPPPHPANPPAPFHNPAQTIPRKLLVGFPYRRSDRKRTDSRFAFDQRVVFVFP